MKTWMPNASASLIRAAKNENNKPTNKIKQKPEGKPFPPKISLFKL